MIHFRDRGADFVSYFIGRRPEGASRAHDVAVVAVHQRSPNAPPSLPGPGTFFAFLCASRHTYPRYVATFSNAKCEQSKRGRTLKLR
eukprot:2204646-Rhodomonas_salina.2